MHSENAFGPFNLFSIFYFQFSVYIRAKRKHGISKPEKQDFAQINCFEEMIH